MKHMATEQHGKAVTYYEQPKILKVCSLIPKRMLTHPYLKLSILTNRQTNNQLRYYVPQLETLKHILFKPDYTCSSVHSG